MCLLRGLPRSGAGASARALHRAPPLGTVHGPLNGAVSGVKVGEDPEKNGANLGKSGGTPCENRGKVRNTQGKLGLNQSNLGFM